MFKKAIVTGGAGFIGSNLVDKLIDMGIQVSVIDDFSTGKMENTNKKAHYWKQDLSKVDIDELTQFMEGVDVVFHLAALARVQPSIEDPITFNKVNVDGTLNILWAAHKAGIKRVIYSASSSCYGNNENFPTPETEPTNPLSPYGLQKYLGEHYCKMFNQQDFQYLTQLPDIIKDSGTVGEFQIGNLKITIIALDTFEQNLINN